MHPAMRDIKIKPVSPLASAPASALPERLYDYQFALCLGINKYHHHLKLESAVNDANDMSRALMEQLGFDVAPVLIDEQVTLQSILAKIGEYSNHLTERSLFALFFAGHGTDHGGGYIIPADGALLAAHNELDAIQTWISFKHLLHTLKTALANRCCHRFLLIDACNSGLIEGERETLKCPDVNVSVDYKPAGVALTSGSAHDTVLDVGRNRRNSPFTCAIFDALEEFAPGQFILPEELATKVIRDVHLSTKRNPRFASNLEALGGPGRIWLRKAGPSPIAPTPAPRPASAPHSATPSSLIQSFAVRIADADLCLTDGNGRFCHVDRAEKRIRGYLLGQDDIVAQHDADPDVPCKFWLPALWRNQVVCADWNGELLAFDPWNDSTAPVRLRPPAFDDLPFHTASVGADGQLAAATWDGQIVVWNAPAQPHAPRVFRSAHLPLSVFPLRNDGLAVFDQRGTLRVFDANATELSKKRLDGSISDLCSPFRTDEPSVIAAPSLFYLNAQRRISEFKTGALPDVGPMRVVTSYDQANRRKAVAILDDGKIVWLSLSPFKKDAEFFFPHETPADLVPLHDPGRPRANIALIRTAEGNVWSVTDGQAEPVIEPIMMGRNVRRILADGFGRRMFCCFADRVECHRLSVLKPLKCQFTVSEPKGSLKYNTSQKIEITVKNDAAHPMHGLTFKLEGAACRERKLVSDPPTVLPGGGVATLTFLVTANSPGVLDLELTIQSSDAATPFTTKLLFTSNER